ncbi:hypothetical protein ACOM2C_08560 [Pseudarthrobacter sp. So.54]
MTAGLTVAIASGTRLSPLMSTMQLVSVVSMAVAVASFVTAASVQPRSLQQDSLDALGFTTTRASCPIP